MSNCEAQPHRPNNLHLLTLTLLHSLFAWHRCTIRIRLHPFIHFKCLLNVNQFYFDILISTQDVWDIVSNFAEYLNCQYRNRGFLIHLGLYHINSFNRLLNVFYSFSYLHSKGASSYSEFNSKVQNFVRRGHWKLLLKEPNCMSRWLLKL